MRDVQVWIDTEDVISQLDRKDILRIAEEFVFEPQSRESAIEAINQIRTGRNGEAAVTLERCFLPKWKDVAECEARYREVMGRVA